VSVRDVQCARTATPVRSTRRTREPRDATFGGVRVRRAHRRRRRNARDSRVTGRPSRRVQRLWRRSDGCQPVRIARTVGGGDETTVRRTVVGAKCR